MIVTTHHTQRFDVPKIVKACTLPITGNRVVDLIITELAVFKVSKSGGPLLLIEKAPEVTVDYIRQRTAADMIVSDNLIDMLQ